MPDISQVTSLNESYLQRLRNQNQAKRDALAKQQAAIKPAPASVPSKPAAASVRPPPTLTSTPPTPPPPPQKSAATLQLEQEALNMAKYGSAIAPAAPPTAPPVVPAAPAAPAPAAPQVPSQLEALRKSYLGTFGATPEETAASKSLADIQARQATLAASEGLGLEKVSRQAIPMPFITGQQAAVQRQTAALQKALEAEAMPLTTQLALKQAERERQQKMLEAEIGFAKPQVQEVGGSLVEYDPATGTYKAVYEKPAEAKAAPALIQEYQYAQSQGYKGSLTDYQKEIAAAKAAVAPGATPTSWDEYSRTTTAPTQEGYAAFLASKKGTVTGGLTQAAKDFQTKSTQTAVSYIDTALGQVGTTTSGIIGSQMAKVPGTAAYNLNQTLDTIKSNLSFGTLQDMRNASKTGGALGAVSDRETALLSSVMGSLDIGQSPAQLKTNLEKIKESLTRWNQALMAEPTEQTTAENEEIILDGKIWVDDGTGNYVPKAEAPTAGAKTGGSVSYRNNNPLNIKMGEFAQKYGAVTGTPAKDGGVFATFPDVETGMKAAKDLLRSSSYANLPLEQAMRRWSGNGYGADVAPANVRNKTIAQMNDSEINSLISSMRTREGWFA